MFLHDAIADAQAKSSALADRLRRVERIENFVGILHARPGIGKLGDDRSVFRKGADQQHSTANRLHRIRGIADQVIKHLQQLVRVAANRRQNAGAIFEFDADVLAM